MSPTFNLRTSLAYVLIFSLVVTGLLTFSTRQSHASNSSLPRSSTSSVKESSEKTLPQAGAVDEETRKRLSEAYGKLPLSFEENRGQVDAEVRYISRGASYTLFLTPTEAVLTLRQSDGKKATTTVADARLSRVPSRPHLSQTSVLRMKLSGANNAPAITGESEMGVKTNYFIGNDPQQWHTNVERYERVRYAQVYPGVDMIYYGEQQQLEYDFEVAPGADARRIALEFEGIKRVRIEGKTGDLILKTAGGEVRQHKPVAYQEVGGVRQEVASRYVMRSKHKVRIEVGEYDWTRPLVIDPVLSYSTYLGGNGFYSGNGLDFSYSIAVDSSGHAYVTGLTRSDDFPKSNEYSTGQVDEHTADAFVTKLDTNASGAASLLYSTYLGGSGGDYGTGIAVDAAGHAYVTGETFSTDFPMLNEYQTDQAGTDAFVTKLDTNASGAASLLYSTYLGGSGGDYGTGIAVDAAGHAYVTGATSSSDFPTLNQYQTYQGPDGYPDAFMAKLDTNASGAASLLYSTYLGGNDDDGGKGIAIDSSGHAYVTGQTYSSDFPTLNEYQTGGGVFVTKLDPNLSGTASLLYSTYLAGSSYDYSTGIAVDAAGHAYVTGQTYSSDFPTLNQYQTYQGPDGYPDAFVTKLDTNASGAASLLYSTYLGGSNSDAGLGIAVDTSGHAYVTGYTYSINFPTLNECQTDQRDVDAFVTKLTDSYSIGGKITRDTAAGPGLAGVSVTLTGGLFEPRTVNTTSNGTYSFGNLQTAGNYKITPSSAIYNFSPAQLVLYNVTTDQINQNFTATLKTYTVGGVVKLGAAGLSGVTVKLTSPTPAGFTARTTTTSSTGAYSFTGVPAGRNYTVTLTKAGYQFNPLSKSLTNLSANQTAVNFVVKVYNITGRITRTGTTTGIGAVTVTVTSPTPANFPARTVQASSTGVYTFTTLPAGRNYTLKPTKNGFTFTPATRSITNLSGNIPAGASTNFTGTGP